mmetsp:Transcript_21826/g.70476  ORF Transcript_21826/g.70476 Transcript_21826/m.70476 type:complete len:258 (+) Transcript_21826:702-1475(+)
MQLLRCPELVGHLFVPDPDKGALDGVDSGLLPLETQLLQPRSPFSLDDHARGPAHKLGRGDKVKLHFRRWALPFACIAAQHRPHLVILLHDSLLAVDDDVPHVVAPRHLDGELDEAVRRLRLVRHPQPHLVMHVREAPVDDVEEAEAAAKLRLLLGLEHLDDVFEVAAVDDAPEKGHRRVCAHGGSFEYGEHADSLLRREAVVKSDGSDELESHFVELAQLFSSLRLSLLIHLSRRCQVAEAPASSSSSNSCLCERG